MITLKLHEHELQVLQTVLAKLLADDLNRYTGTIHEYRTVASIEYKLQEVAK